MINEKIRYQTLLDQLQDYSYQYYTLENPSVSDAVYDGLIRELKELEAKYPDIISPQSPTQRVGNALLEGFKKAQHQTRMYSLNDVFDRKEVEDWVNRMDKLIPGQKHEYFCDLKMDGLACSLIYRDGVLIQAVTRGDSVVGEDVTMNVKTIKNIPLRLRNQPELENMLQGRTEIRGEIIMLKKDFDNLNKKRLANGQAVFANPRNLAAGTIRQLDPKLVAKRPLNFRAYDLMRDDNKEIPTHSFAYESLAKLGIQTSQKNKVFDSIEGVMKFVDDWETKRQSLEFNTDGIVIKVNDRKIYRELGVVGKNPRGAVAYKYPAEEATTVVKDIVISIGRTGAATPVAVFDPVQVAGTTVQHASLHNADEIARKDIRVGDTVVIYKAGDIIPQVEHVIEKLRPKTAMPFGMEKELARQYPELEFERPKGEAVYRVKGVTSAIILKRAVAHFASKGALDIDTLGEKNVDALVDSGLVRDLADIYLLKHDDIIKLERFAELSTANLINAIKSKKSPSLAKFTYALGIRHVGAQTAVELANTFKRLDNIGTATYEELKSVDGVGEIVAESILAWFADPDNEELLAKFRKLGVWPQDVTHTGGKLSGKKFAITGSLDSMGRDLAAEKIRAKGGTFQSSVGSDTDYLVVGKNVGESKLKKASKFGTKQITEHELNKLIA